VQIQLLQPVAVHDEPAAHTTARVPRPSASQTCAVVAEAQVEAPGTQTLILQAPSRQDWPSGQGIGE
jgi:hypothetical protein